MTLTMIIDKVHLKQTVDDGNNKRLNATFMRFYMYITKRQDDIKTKKNPSLAN